MTRNLWLVGLLIGWSASASPVYAESIGKAQARSAEITQEVGKNLFEVERCLISAPYGAIPSVYRQPDMPDRVVLAWETSNFSSAITVVEMNGTNPIELKFWGKDGAWQVFQRCLE